MIFAEKRRHACTGINIASVISKNS